MRDRVSDRPQAPHPGTAEPHRVLVAATVRWPTGARLALALERAGFAVDAIYPPEHPLGSTRAVQNRYTYSAIDPLGTLTRAMLASEPSMVIPCDDRVVGHIHAIYDRCRDTSGGVSSLGSLIERSLGDPAFYATTTSRAALMRLARQEQVQVPQGRAVASVQDLRSACNEIRLPWVMKVDGTWGGGGIKIVRSIQAAERSLRAMVLNQGAKRLNHLIIHRDRFLLRDLVRNPFPSVTLQQFIHGHPATSLVACWKGEILAQINVEVLGAQGETGASTIVRVIDHAEMDGAAARLVRRLGLSGFCGFDFMIETASRRCFLIEMNPRNTQLGHLNLGHGRDLTAALYARIVNAPVRQHPVTTDSALIAFFPQAERFNPFSLHLRSAYLDVPYEDLGLLRELARTPYNGRGLMARAFNMMKRRVHDPTAPRRLPRSITPEQNIT